MLGGKKDELSYMRIYSANLALLNKAGGALALCARHVCVGGTTLCALECRRHRSPARS